MMRTELTVTQFVVGAMLGAVAFFARRSFSQYDERLATHDDRSEKIIGMLHELDKKITRIEEQLTHIRRGKNV